MNSSFSRRAFLEGAAATVGAVLISGCSSDSNAQPKAMQKGDGFLLSGTQLPPAGEAVSFAFPGGEQGLLYQTKSGQSGAVSAVCTHQGCIVEWTDEQSGGAFACPCHQSNFDLNGKVLGGPAKAPLAHFKARQNGGDVELKIA